MFLDPDTDQYMIEIAIERSYQTNIPKSKALEQLIATQRTLELACTGNMRITLERAVWN